MSGSSSRSLQDRAGAVSAPRTAVIFIFIFVKIRTRRSGAGAERPGECLESIIDRVNEREIEDLQPR